MNLIHAIRRLAGILAGLATAALASTAAPAALASTPPGRSPGAAAPGWCGGEMARGCRPAYCLTQGPVPHLGG